MTFQALAAQTQTHRVKRAERYENTLAHAAVPWNSWIYDFISALWEKRSSSLEIVIGV